MSDAKRTAEEEYFAKLNKEKEEKIATEVAAQKAAADRAAARELHANRCGKCGGLLHPQDFRGVEIDVCEDCGAVVLDQGELETLAGHDQSGVLAGLKGLFSFKGRPTAS
jgi:Transcription factor zinc-finger